MSNSEDKISKPNGLGTDPMQRLASFKPPRDLSLGGAKPKKVFTPNLNVIRNKNKGPSTTNSRDQKKDDKGRKDRRNDRNKNIRNGPNVIKSSGVFSEGLGSAERHYSRSSYGSRESDSTPALQKPTIRVKDVVKIDRELEEQKIKSVLGDHGNDDDDSNEDFKHVVERDAPIKLPMDDGGWVHSQPKAVIKKEVSIKTEPRDDVDCAILTEPADVKPDVKKEVFEDTDVVNLLRSDKPTLILLQLPDTLPGRGGSIDDDAPRRKPADEPSTSSGEGKEDKPSSLPPLKFNGIFKANNDSIACPQKKNNNNKILTLDCLTLNIYVPNSAHHPLPVFFYIFGGRHINGNSGIDRYGPKYLVKQNIIVVTINYRLGPYGFFCLDTPKVSANQALKDQLRALRWLKENIKNFGGDPNDITIAGNSSGSVNVDFHLRSHQEKMFNKAILQSGAGIIPQKITKMHINVPMKIARHIGFNTSNLNEALLFLSNVEPKDVIKASLELDVKYKVCAEKIMDGVDAFISEDSYDKYPKLDNITVMMGVTEYEGFMDYRRGSIVVNNNMYVFSDPLKKYFNLEADDLNRTEQIVRHFYIGDKHIDDEVLWPVIDFYSDLQFIHPSMRTVDVFTNNSAKAVYFYVFIYVGERNFMREVQKFKENVATHADELGYLFDMEMFSKRITAEDQLMIERITTLWANFVKGGDPTPVPTKLLPFKWEPVTKDHLNYLTIDKYMKMGQRPFKERMAFWDLLYKIYYK